MLDQVLSLFKIKPDFDLDIMQDKQGLTEITRKILDGVDKVIQNWKPRLILVHGDTSTCFASAVAAFYNHVLVGHVEAGLRTNNINNPFPEEFNRQVVSRIANFNFAPSDQSAQNLKLEGVQPDKIFVTGNTIIDSMQSILREIDRSSTKRIATEKEIEKILKFDWKKGLYILVTCHRRENHGKGIQSLCKALSKLAMNNPNLKVIFSVHLNPRIYQPAHKSLSEVKNIILINPLEYTKMLLLIRNCYFVITDSGGLQEEAPSLGKPVLLVRHNTERPETVKAGSVKLIGITEGKIVSEAEMLLKSKSKYSRMANTINPYGKGDACDRIIKIIKDYFGPSQKS